MKGPFTRGCLVVPVVRDLRTPKHRKGHRQEGFRMVTFQMVVKDIGHVQIGTIATHSSHMSFQYDANSNFRVQPLPCAFKWSAQSVGHS